MTRRSIIRLLAVLVVLVSAGAGISAYINRPGPPVNVELSNVPGVSILRRSRWQSRQVVNVKLNDRRSSRIYRDGYELIYALCDATDQQYPIIQHARLPDGYYRVAASTERGGQETLLNLLCTAYEQAFGLDVAVREVETYALVMTCPDPQALKFKPSARRHPYLAGDFTEAADGTSVPRQTWYSVEFACDMDNLASFSAYMIRKAFHAQRPAVRDRLLVTAIINETGLTGFYDGKLAWKFYEPDSLITELTAAGLKLTLSKRTVKALAIAPRP